MAEEISNANAPSVVDSSGNPVKDATIIAVKQEDVAALSQSQATEIQALVKLTDVNGDFTFSENELYSDQNQYVVVALEESGEQRGTPNYPHVDASGFTIPDSDLVHRNNFEQDLTDSVGNANLTAQGDEAYSQDAAEGIYATDLNAGDYHTTTAVNPYDDYGSFSIVISFKPDNISSSGWIYAAGSWRVKIVQTNSDLEIAVWDGANAVGHTFTGSLSTDYHLAGIAYNDSNSEFSVYLDSSSSEQVLSSTIDTQEFDGYAIGDTVRGSRTKFEGLVDVTLTYSRRLSNSEFDEIASELGI